MQQQQQQLQQQQDEYDDDNALPLGPVLGAALEAPEAEMETTVMDLFGLVVHIQHAHSGRQLHTCVRACVCVIVCVCHCVCVCVCVGRALR